MKNSLFRFLILILLFGNGSCFFKNKSASSPALLSSSVPDSIIYHSDQLSILQLGAGSYQHISFLATQDFGRVSCNGMIAVHENQAVLFDTPTDNQSAEELINFIQNSLKAKIIALIPTHFHQDCVGGLSKFKEYDIPVYASTKTLQYLKEKGEPEMDGIHPFDQQISFLLGNQKIIAEFLGEGHTRDNIVGYFPADQILFGGCLIKELNASKGNLEDANVTDWSTTVQEVRKRFPNIKVVIPGHGKSGGKELLTYTEQLFQK